MGLAVGLYVLSRVAAMGLVDGTVLVAVGVFITIVLAAVTAKSWSLWRGLKRVTADDRFLYLSDYSDSREVAVPLNDVIRVSQWRGKGIRPVTVHLRSTAYFGGAFKFQPAIRPGESISALKENKVVGELRALAGLDT